MFTETVNSAIHIQEKRSKRDSSVKEKILSMIKDKIENASNRHNKTNCIFTVPTFIIGYIPYNVEEMSSYAMKKMIKDGLYVIKLNNENLYISWHINDLHRLNKKTIKKTECGNLDKKKNNNNNNNNNIKSINFENTINNNKSTIDSLIMNFANKNKL
jgi:hypothetical protein